MDWQHYICSMPEWELEPKTFWWQAKCATTTPSPHIYVIRIYQDTPLKRIQLYMLLLLIRCRAFSFSTEGLGFKPRANHAREYKSLNLSFLNNVQHNNRTIIPKIIDCCAFVSQSALKALGRLSQNFCW